MGFIGFVIPILTILQCTSRRRKKSSPPVTLVRQSVNSPESNLLRSGPSETGLDSSVPPYVHANPKNFADYPEAVSLIHPLWPSVPLSVVKLCRFKANLKIQSFQTQSTQSAGADSPVEPQTSQTQLPTPTQDKKKSQKDENPSKEKPAAATKPPPPPSSEIPTAEASLISPSLKAIKKWEKNMRKDFPEISDRTQPPNSTTPNG